MGRTKIYSAILLLAITVLAGCLQTESQAEKEYVCADGKTTVKSIAACPPVQVSAEQKDPYLTTCEEMPDSDRVPFADYCYMGLAYKQENATLCKKLGESRRMECYSAIASLKNDVTLCDGAGSQKSYCYSNYATQNGDVTACDKITDINYKDNCYSQYGSRFGDATVCEMIKISGSKDNCYMSVASSQCDTSLCAKMSNANMKEQCTTNLQYCSGQQQPKQPIKQG